MIVSAGSAGSGLPLTQAGISDEARQAIGSLLARDRGHILSVANSLRGSHRSIESTVRGGSMGETLPPGTRIRIELEQDARYMPGDVVAFFVGTTLVVHRIVADIGKRRVITRGDATYAPDPPVAFSNILGRVGAMQCSGSWQDVPADRKRSVARGLVATTQTNDNNTLAHVDVRFAARTALLIHRGEALLRAPRVREAAPKSAAGR